MYQRFDCDKKIGITLATKDTLSRKLACNLTNYIR